MQCPQCKHENHADALICDACGNRLELSCPSCTHENPPGSEFCNKCGRNLSRANRADQREQQSLSLLEKRVSHQEITGKIAKAVGSTVEPGELFRIIVQEIRKVVPCDRCSIMALDRNSGQYQVFYRESDIDLRNLTGEEIRKVWWFQSVYTQARPIRSDLREISDPRAKGWLESGLISHMAIPILRDDRCIASLISTSTKADAFTDDHEILLMSLTSHLGAAIQNAQLHGEVRESQRFFESVGGDNADAIILVNRNEEITLWNDAAQRLFGYTREEALGRIAYNFLVPKNKIAQVKEATRRLRESGTSQIFEGERLRKDGTLVPVAVTISPVKDETGNIIARSAVYKDLTERRKAEETVRKLSRARASRSDSGRHSS